MQTDSKTADAPPGSAPLGGSALWRLVVSKSEICGYAEWHAKLRATRIVYDLKQKRRDARRRMRVLTLKLQLAKETCQ